MTTPTLQSILTLNDRDFNRWVAEQEQPGPWPHDPDPRKNKHCQKCGANRTSNHDKSSWWRRGEHLPSCPHPDPLTRSLAEIVAEQIRILMPMWWDWPKIEPAAKAVLSASIVNIPGATYPFDRLPEWFIWAGPKVQYVCLWLAGQERKMT